MTDTIKTYIIIGLLIGIGVAFGGGMYWGMDIGETAERSLWQGKENKELVAANDKIKKLMSENLRLQQEGSERVAAISLKLQKENADELKKRDELIASYRNGTMRLRIPIASIETFGNTSGKIGTDPSQSNGGEKAGFLGEADQAFLVSEAFRANQIVRELNACKEILVEDRRICNRDPDN